MTTKKRQIKFIHRPPVTSTFKKATNDHKSIYQRLLSNNQYLLESSDKLLISQLKEFRALGLKMGKTCYFEILKGNFCSLNYAIPHFLSYYWGIPVQTLLFEDLRQKDELNEIKKAIRVDSSPFVG